ncbi:MAG: hypothetical protein KDC90_05035 [Ignavibacteriae bacterium]|nr:hypothetical protein [Ignavibacteriota bacterium]
MNDFIVSIDDQKLDIISNDFSKVNVDGENHNCDISQLSEHTFKLVLENKIFHITTFKINNGKQAFLVDGHYFEAKVNTALEEKVSQYLSKNSTNKLREEILSPMPGLILKVYKNVGEKINQGEPLLLLEAMKMENEIHTPKTGIVKSIEIKIGCAVEKNQLLAIIE